MTYRRWALQELNLRPHAYQTATIGASMHQSHSASYRCVGGAVDAMVGENTAFGGNRRSKTEHAPTPGGGGRCGWCLALPAEPCAKLARHLPCARGVAA